jgi:NAD(P)-dependent dehydrogenase (short-subunit alcohol dehydrogenase family)
MAGRRWDLGAGLEGRGVIVTGAGGGIGREVVSALDAAGARILAVDRTDALAGSALEPLGPAPGTGHVALGADLADLATHAGLIDTAVSELGDLYALVHLAAVLKRQPSLATVSEEDWDLQVDTNFKATFFLCRAVAERLVERGGGGRLIAFTSQGWLTGGFGGSVVYNATKGGIVTMMRGMARTYGPHGITVNTIAPGQVRTPMLLTGLDERVLQSMTDATPLGRIAEPDELAGTVVFLASRHAGFITGATINVTGGFLMY